MNQPPSSQTCPVCSTAVAPSARYPRSLCKECSSRAAARDGRKLVFFNESISGGFVAKYADTGEPYPGHECYVDGIPCHADEHYFGGIVIQTLQS
ncbi:MAG TPA: hypothetical protein PKL78_06550 [Anaerolineales bacterium]|nr:hypothetical protein [Anaerolineales bacterium]HNN13200.1 hypothetical protein [Anaerolineales bacterium]HNO31318.1 hypothetical protein [Anaerolineales bacterium]